MVGGEARRGRLRVAGRVGGEDDPQDEEHEREAGEGAGDPELDAAAALGRLRRTAAAAAEAADRAEQAEVDRDDHDRRGDEADPNQGVYLAGARRVRRQGGAILITASGVDAVCLDRHRPILADAMRRHSRPPRGTAGRQGRSSGHRRRRDRPSTGAKAPPDPRPGDPRRRRLRAARGRRPGAPLAQTRRRPLRDADVGVHGRPRDALRRSGEAAPPSLHPLPDRDRLADRRRPAARGAPADAARRPPRHRARSTASSRSPTGSGSSSPTRSSSGSWSATRSASPAPPARWPPSSTPAPSATGRCRPRRPGGRPSRD